MMIEMQLRDGPVARRHLITLTGQAVKPAPPGAPARRGRDAACGRDQPSSRSGRKVTMPGNSASMIAKPIMINRKGKVTLAI